MGWDGMITPGRTLDILPVPADAGKESLRGWWELPTDRRPRRKWNAAEGIEFVPPRNGKGARCRFFNCAAVMMIRL